MNRRDFMAGLTATAGAAAASGMGSAAAMVAGTQPKRRPNIVFLLVDDLGWGDFGCYGSTYHETPNIDQLAREGMRLTQAYAGAPVCSPSRACIMTGQVPARLHLTQWLPGVVYPYKMLVEPKALLELPKGTPTLATELKKAGYQTAALGKWHLGGEGALPEDFGFDLNIAGDNHGHPALPHGYFGPFEYHNLSGYTANDNLTEVLDDKVDEYLEQAAKKGPFFLYLAEYAVHIPLQERAARVEKYRRKDPSRDASQIVYAALVETVDIAVGRLRKKLSQLGIAENTIIVLTSDNGGLGFQGRSLHTIADNGPFRGGKGYLYEGGIREPLIILWPGVTKAGSEATVPVWGADFMPTLISCSGVTADPPDVPRDGVDITPVLKGSSVLRPSSMYWHYPHYSDQGATPAGAIREGDWKLIEFFEDGHLELYNLALDPGERYNLSSSFSERATAMQTKLALWRRSVNASMPSNNPAFDPRKVQSEGTPAACMTVPGSICAED